MSRRASMDDLQVGDWSFHRSAGGQYIAIRLLDGDHGLAMLPISESLDGMVDGRKAWQWNGSLDLPTLSPSIQHWGNGRDNPPTWHGFLRDGQLVLA